MMKTPAHRIRYQHSAKGRATRSAWKKANRDRVNASARANRKRNRKTRRAAEKRYRERYPEKWSEKLRRHAQRQRERISDGYVRILLSAHGSPIRKRDWPDSLVQTKRAIVALERQIV
jgi:hypothetical protein